MQEIFYQFILPTLIIMAIAALLGFLLSYLGQKLKVDQDELVEQITENLSGANCGACGYAGCAAYAKALKEGKATLDLCRPTPNDSKNVIAKLLGVQAATADAMRAVVHCGGGDKCKNKHSYIGLADCSSASSLSGGAKACSVGCLGFGDCKNACKFSAVEIKDNLAQILKDECVACGACVKACPKNLITLVPSNAKVLIACKNTSKAKEVMEVCSVGCIACNRCAKTCPQNAIVVENNLAIINYEKCTGCLQCVDVCPRKTIQAI